MRPDIHGGSAWGYARDPLEWFLSDTLDPSYQVPPRPTSGSVPRRSTRPRAGSFRVDIFTFSS
jgi:hypothetical protein